MTSKITFQYSKKGWTDRGIQFLPSKRDNCITTPLLNIFARENRKSKMFSWTILSKENVLNKAQVSLHRHACILSSVIVCIMFQAELQLIKHSIYNVWTIWFYFIIQSTRLPSHKWCLGGSLALPFGGLLWIFQFVLALFVMLCLLIHGNKYASKLAVYHRKRANMIMTRRIKLDCLAQEHLYLRRLKLTAVFRMGLLIRCSCLLLLELTYA